MVSPQPTPLTHRNAATALDVVCGLLFDAEHRVLMARRPAHKCHGGLWEFPGGKVDAGESFADALIREWREEMAVEISVDRAHPSVAALTSNGTPLTLHPFRIHLIQGQPQAREHEALAWVDLASLSSLPMPDGDQAIAATLPTISA